MKDFTMVQSSSIEAVKHDTDELVVIFKSGEMYKYKDVTAEEFEALIKADSVGKHFHKHIRSAKEFEKCVESIAA